MSWSDEYFALVNQKKKKEKATQDTYRQAIRGGFERKRQREAMEEAERKQKQSGYFSKGAFEDGYQFGDVLKTLHGTAKDVEQHLVAGALNIGEGFVDTAAMLAEGAAHLIGDKTTAQGLKDFRGKNIIDEQAIAQVIVGGIPGWVNPKNYDDTSLLGGRSDNVVSSIGQQLAVLGLHAVGVPWEMSQGVTSFGSEAEFAANEGASYGEAALSGLISAGLTVGTGKMFGGSGLGEKGLINLDSATKGIKNRVARQLAAYGVDMAAEGVEEVIEGVASALAQQQIYAKDKDFEELFSKQDFWDAIIAGGISSGVFNVGKLSNSIKTKTDYRTGLNETEQKVFDKLYKEASEGKTKAEQTEIYDELMEKMEKGYISVESIEEILGDKASVEALQAESDEFNKLYNTVGNQLSKAQSDRLAALEAKNKATAYADALKNAKGEMSQKVYEQVKGTKLEESYREKARRGQAFQADVSRYDAKQQALVKKAMDSGVLNNTRRTHEFVDMIAKIGAEKGISFDFTNNEKLKASGFAMDGKMVNGFVSGGNVTLNIHSAKALNSVVGHEITHVLEGTELYDSLKQTLFDYAKTKGEYQGRYDELAKLYENVKDANIEGELVADLVGDYIFSDADFVKNLSTGNRNVFQRIFDEIKYLAKVATKGSKEARELEKVKKIFEEAYRESGKAQKNTIVEDGVRYALADIEAVTPTESEKNQNIMTVASMEPVHSVDASKLIPGEKSIKEIYQENFEAWGGNIHSDTMGDIAVKNSSIRSEMRHGSTPVKVASVEAIPSVIQNGKIVEWFKKDTGLFRIVVAAPIEIGNQPYFMGVMLQRDAQNQRLYLHDVAIEKEVLDHSQEHLDSTGPHEGTENLYTSSILDRIVEVKRKMQSPYMGKISDAQKLDAAKDIAPTQFSLSEQGKSEGVNYSLSDSDTAYMEAVNRGDMTAAQKMVDEAAKAAGYTIKAFHGTDADSFHVFDKGRIGSASGVSILGDGFYFAEKKKIAAQYGKYVHAVYLKQVNSYEATGDDAYKLNAAKLEADGYDGVKLPVKDGNIYMVLDPEQIKSADPVTYDEQGNVIPLSERFNPENKDIRYSLSEIGEQVKRGRGTYGEDIMLAPVKTETVNTDNMNGVVQGQETFITTEDKLKHRYPPVGTEKVDPGEHSVGETAPIRPKPNKKSTEPKMVRADNKGEERSWYKTSSESEAVDGKVKPEDIPDEMRYYQPIPNKKTLGNANAELERLGYDQAVVYFNNQINAKKVSLDDIALGERLIQEAVKKGDYNTASELIQNVAILGTELGQKVQALSIIQKLTPEGQLKMLQKIVNRGKAKKDNAFDGVEVTEEMVRKILSARKADGSFDQVYLSQMVEDVKQQIADQMKVTAWEKINAWRYLSMLGNPKTHIRNVVSNVAMLGTRTVKNAIARTMEDISPMIAPIGRTKTWERSSEDVKAFASKMLEEMEADIDGSKYSETGDIKSKRQIFKNTVMNAVSNANSGALQWEDALFSKPAFKSAFSEFLTANGIKSQMDIKKNGELVAKAKQYALKQAREATFQQDSYLANKISEIERRNPAYNVAIGAVLPFKKTPINIAKAGLSYSPLGFARNIYDAVQVSKGNMEVSEAIDHLAQTITGTSLAVVGAMLASVGILNGAGDDDKEGKYDYQLGKQAYSFNFGDNTFSLSWLSPVAMPLFVGVNAFEQLVEGKEWNADIVMETLAQTLDPLSEMSFLSSLDSVLSSYDSGIQKFMGIFETAAQNYVTQFIPTLSSQIAATFDDTKRSTQVAANSDFQFGDRLVNQIKYKIPGLRNTLAPTTDIWGNEVKQTENTALRALENFFAPWSRRGDISTGVDEQIKDVYRQTGDGGVIPSIPDRSINFGGVKYEMSTDEHTTIKQTYGQTAYDLMRKLFKTETYRKADYETKADMIGRVYDYAWDVAKQEFLEGRDVEYTNATEDGVKVYKEDPIRGAIEHDMSVDEYKFYVDYPGKHAVTKVVGGFNSYKEYTSALYDIHADKDEDGKTKSGSRKEKVLAYINGLDASYDEKIVLYKMEYPSDDRYNRDILEYIKSRTDLSYQEKLSICEELGFKVSSDGYVTWD